MEYIRQNPLIVRRFFILIFAAAAGVLLARFGVNALQKWIGAPLEQYSFQLALLLLSLPVLCALWQFRTADTQAQIKETKEGADATRDATSASSLGRCMDALSSENLRTRCLGLIQLADIRRKGKHAEEIDNATCQHLNLEKAILHGANLSGLNLEGADFKIAGLNNTNLSGVNLQFAQMQGAKLPYANLQGANLEGARLEGADMRDVDFSKANLWEAKLGASDLKGAVLSLAKNLGKATLVNAKYDETTKFPDNFIPAKAGMKFSTD